MEDTTLSITGIIIAAIIMFIVPLVMIADRNDDISQLLVETYTAEFVDNIIKTGKISNEDYEQYIISLGTSGNTYDVNIELKILDENPARRYTNATGATGENSYYSLFTSQIEEELNRNEKIILKVIESMLKVYRRNVNGVLHIDFTNDVMQIMKKIEGDKNVKPYDNRITWQIRQAITKGIISKE